MLLAPFDVLMPVSKRVLLIVPQFYPLLAQIAESPLRFRRGATGIVKEFGDPRFHLRAEERLVCRRIAFRGLVITFCQSVAEGQVSSSAINCDDHAEEDEPFLDSTFRYMRYPVMWIVLRLVL